MRPAWRLGINSLSERRSRTALLIATVALSALLIAAVNTAINSLHRGIRDRVASTVGAADLRLQHVGKKVFDAGVLEKIDAWPEVQLAVGRGQDAVRLRNPKNEEELSPTGFGIMPEREYRLRPVQMKEGRAVEALGEVVLDDPAAKRLGVGVGDSVEAVLFAENVPLKVVGIMKAAALGGLARPESYMTLEQLGRLNEWVGKIREVDVVLKPGNDPEKVVEAHAPEFEKGLVLKTSKKITSGLDKSLESSEMGLVVVSALAFLAASFIIMTGMTTSVTERQRELAVVRCIGGSRSQLAESQLVVGIVIGTLGALIGVPLGLLSAYAMVKMLPEQLPAGFGWSWGGLATAVLGAVGAGVVGGVWPALRAARTSPLEALAVRSKKPRARGIILCLVIGLVLVAVHVSILSFVTDLRFVVWGDVGVGMPSMFAGYFLLAVPVTMVVAVVLAPAIGRLMGLPRGLLGRTVVATPYRHGFTSAAMMVGLALLVGIWTNGRAVMSDWLDQMKFPDGFVFGRNFSEATQRKIEQIPGVTATCAITVQGINPKGVFFLPGVQSYESTFIAFEPAQFFRMAAIQFDEGDAATAEKRLEEGGAVLVAREFKTARGLGVGDKVTLGAEGKEHEFEIVGVVNSPGLEIVNEFFDIGETYMEQSISAVFGSRKDLKEKFGNDAINLIQIGIDPKVDDADVIKAARKVGGVIDAGSGRQIKNEIGKFLQGALLVFSIVAVAAMLVACFGVANLIVAGIQARQFEFGVLRAMGAQKGLLARLVLGEALVIAIAACLLGTVMGTHAAWGGRRMNALVIGLTLQEWMPPIGATLAGWGALLLITLGASGPAAWRLMRRQPRELLASVKG
jgi:putative ABC transport system permease protein